MIEHKDNELDDLIRRFGATYNAPPSNPPLDMIRERVHSSRASRRTRTRWIWTGAIAASFALIAIGLNNASLLTFHDSNRPSIADSSLRATRNEVEESTRRANEMLDKALEQAEAAAKANPGDPFYTQHLDAMRNNARHFRDLQQSRGIQGAI